MNSLSKISAASVGEKISIAAGTHSGEQTTSLDAKLDSHEISIDFPASGKNSAAALAQDAALLQKQYAAEIDDVSDKTESDVEAELSTAERAEVLSHWQIL